jgi:hypothetical protein
VTTERRREERERERKREEEEKRGGEEGKEGKFREEVQIKRTHINFWFTIRNRKIINNKIRLRIRIRR